MLAKRIVWTLLMTGVIAISTTTTPAQSTGRRPWLRGDSVNSPAPDQAAERMPVAELETASEEAQTAAHGGLLDLFEWQKLAIAGGWLGTAGGGNKLIATYHSDGTAHNSVQGEVSTNPELGALTPLHGAWRHLGGRRFGATFMGILYDINTGHLNGFLKVRVLLTLNEAGDEMSGTDRVQILDPDGNLVVTFPRATRPTSALRSSRSIKRQPLLAGSRRGPWRNTNGCWLGISPASSIILDSRGRCPHNIFDPQAPSPTLTSRSST